MMPISDSGCFVSSWCSPACPHATVSVPVLQWERWVTLPGGLGSLLEQQRGDPPSLALLPASLQRWLCQKGEFLLLSQVTGKVLQAWHRLKSSLRFCVSVCPLAPQLCGV